MPALIELFHSTSSVLLRHEIAYALGQMQRIQAVAFLDGVLSDDQEDPITRHEAAEALGAIEAPESLEILSRHAADSASEVSETCLLALNQLNYQIAKGVCGCERRPQEALRLEADAAAATASDPLPGTASTGGVAAADEESKDATSAAKGQPAPQPPAPTYTYVSPAPAAKAAPVATLRHQLLDGSAPLFERYRALFALRDAVPAEGSCAVDALCECLSRRTDESGENSPPDQQSPSPRPAHRCGAEELSAALACPSPTTHARVCAMHSERRSHRHVPATC